MYTSSPVRALMGSVGRAENVQHVVSGTFALTSDQ